MTAADELDFSIRPPGEDDAGTGSLRLRLRGRGDLAPIASDRLARAIEWALDLDAHYRTLVRAGRSLQVDIPETVLVATERVRSETITNYRELRLSVGELIRPLLLDTPKLGQLYPYQHQGVEWLINRSGCILADDMGLGKTVQVISAMRLLFNRAELRTALVICPKGLIATWEREFSCWAPELGVAVLVPPARLREDAWKTVAGRQHVLLTNYEQFRTPPEILRRTPPDLIVTDEAHRLRKPGSKVTSGVFELRPKRFWALTGTPLERDLEDMATLLSLVAPNRFAPTDAKLHPSSLRSRAKLYVLRRRKQEVLQDLPPILDTTEILDLSEAQERAYRAAVNEYRRANKKGMELALLTKLQMLCDLDPESRASCKVDRILYLLGRIREQGEKAVVFSYRLEPLRELQTRVAKRWRQESAELLLGEMNGDERNHAVTRFRDDKRVLALLASSRVGGEGLTLVEANHVFLLNQWWNPSANDQARDRVVRIGQHRKVRIYRFCCRGTVEEAVERILETKRELFKNVVEHLAHSEDAIWHQVLSEVGIDHLLSGQVAVSQRRLD